MLCQQHSLTNYRSGDLFYAHSYLIERSLHWLLHGGQRANVNERRRAYARHLCGRYHFVHVQQRLRFRRFRYYQTNCKTRFIIKISLLCRRRDISLLRVSDKQRYGRSVVGGHVCVCRYARRWSSTAKQCHCLNSCFVRSDHKLLPVGPIDELCWTRDADK